MIKKVSTTCIALICCLSAMADNFFVNGTRWSSIVSAIHPDGTPIYWEREVTLQSDSVSGDKSYFTILVSENGETPKPYTNICVENNKVWFRSAADEKEWLLMYDFGLTPGEGSTIWQVTDYADSIHLYSTYLECVDIEDSEDGLKIMTLSVYGNESKEYSEEYPLKWIVGGGSLNGVLKNSGIILDGAPGGVLTEINVPELGVVYHHDFDPTGIESINVGKDVQADDVIYNLQGQKVQNTRKGEIYICNGKLTAK